MFELEENANFGANIKVIGIGGGGGNAVPGAAAPGDDGMAGTSGGADDMAGLDTHRRAKEVRFHADDVLNQFVGLTELLVPVCPGPHPSEMGMIVAVVAEDVALAMDALNDMGILAYVQADDKEGGLDVQFAEDVQDPGG